MTPLIGSGFRGLGFDCSEQGFMVVVSLWIRLRAKPVRTASGIAVVAVMSKPHRCPHIATTGNICVYCPGGPDSDFEYSTQSYTGYEPTSMRAIRARSVCSSSVHGFALRIRVSFLLGILK